MFLLCSHRQVQIGRHAVPARQRPRPRLALQQLQPLRRLRARRIRRRLDRRGRRAGAAGDDADGGKGAGDHHPQRQPGHRLRPFDQSLSRLRARLHLLLRPAQPRLHGPLAWAGFRDQAVLQAGGGAAARTRAVPSAATSRRASSSAPTPTPTSRSSASCRSPARSSRCWRATSTRSASPPRTPWSPATSTSWPRWRPSGWPRSRVSVTTLDRKLARAMEPRASTPDRRIDAIRQLAAAGVPAMVGFAPVIPGLNDHEMEAVLQRGAEAGAVQAHFTVLRLPLEIKDLFREWLEAERPDRAAPRDVAGAPDARRPRLRPRMGQAHARRRAGRRPDRHPLPPGRSASWASTAPSRRWNLASFSAPPPTQTRWSCSKSGKALTRLAF